MSTIAEVNLGIDAAGLSIQPAQHRCGSQSIRFFDPDG
jgi:hypothetical protein